MKYIIQILSLIILGILSVFLIFEKARFGHDLGKLKHQIENKLKEGRGKLKITIEVIPEREDLYYITWEDTIGMKAKYGLLNRPLELWCHIQDLKLDTIGYYRGLSTPSSFTYFETKDSTVTFEFSKAFNFFNEAFFDEKERKAFWEKNKIPVRFEPIEINLNNQLRQKLIVELVEK
ncbi:MAG: hypothetical protein AB8G86_17345 [Saprospiraceae bacterium]